MSRIARCASLAVVLLPVTGVTAPPPEQAGVLILLESSTVEEFHRESENLRRAGMILRHKFPPSAVIGILDVEDERRASIGGWSGVGMIQRDHVNLEDVGPLRPASKVAVQVWNDLFAPGRQRARAERLKSMDASMLTDTVTGDALDPPRYEDPSLNEVIRHVGGSPPYGSSAGTLSAYMIGNTRKPVQIGVAVILPESDGSVDVDTETWSASAAGAVFSSAVAGCDFWATRAPAGVELTFVYESGGPIIVPIPYESINRCTVDDGQWLGAIAGELFPGPACCSSMGRMVAYCHSIRVAHDTDWAFAPIFVNALNDPDNAYPSGCRRTRGGYAYYGGPILVDITYENGSGYYGPLDASLFSHEMGHVFYATDEYQGAGYCGEQSGYLDVGNANHVSCGGGTWCIMRGVGYTSICSSTRGQVGWRDSDGDGIQDIADTEPRSRFLPAPPPVTRETTLTYGVRSEVTPYPRPGGGRGVQINTISRIEYSLNGGSAWSPVPAVDGSYDGGIEDGEFTVGPILNVGPLTACVRAWNVTHLAGTELVESTPACVTTTVYAAPAGAAARVLPSGPFCAGETVDFTVEWANEFNEAFTDVTIVGTFPAGCRYRGASLAFWGRADGSGAPALTASAYAPSAAGPWTPGEPADGSPGPMVLRWRVDRTGKGTSAMIRYRGSVSDTASPGAVIPVGASMTSTMFGGTVLVSATAYAVAAPGRLSVAPSAPARVSTGQRFTVTMTGVNAGSTPIREIAVPLPSMSGTGTLGYLGSTPVPKALEPGEPFSLGWTYSATGSGAVTFSISVSGVVCGAQVLREEVSVGLDVQRAAELAASAVRLTPSWACVGDLVSVGVSVTNSGEAILAGIAGTARVMSGTVIAVSGPIGATVLAGGGGATWRWTYRTVESGQVTVDGTVMGWDANSGNAVAANARATTVSVGMPGALAVQLNAPEARTIGQWFDVTALVSHLGGDPVSNIRIGLTPAGPGTVQEMGGPGSAGGTLTAGQARAFAWTFSASGSGGVALTVTAQGETCGGQPASGADRANVQVQAPAELIAHVEASPPLRETGWGYAVSVTVSNTGEEAANQVGAAVPAQEGAGTAVVTGRPEMTAIAGGEVATLTFTYSAVGEGAVAYTTTLQGVAANTGKPLSAVAGSSASVTIYAAGSLGLEVASLVVAPLGAHQGESITVDYVIRNTGRVPLPGLVGELRLVRGGGGEERFSIASGRSLAPGEDRKLSWSWDATGEGRVVFEVTATAARGSVESVPVRSDAVVIHGELKGIEVYPQPFRRATAVGGEVKFKGVKPGSSLTVYTMRGFKVWSGIGDANGMVRWDGRNEKGAEVQRGVYVWVATDQSGTRRGSLILE